MLVRFDNKFYFLIKQYNLEIPSNLSSQNGKKRKYKNQDVYLLVDSSDSDPIAVLSEHCEKIDSDLSYSFIEECTTFLNHISNYNNCPRLKVSYETNKSKEYFIKSISTILEDGMIVNLHDGEIRHFKFNKLNICCGDGFIKDYNDY